MNTRTYDLSLMIAPALVLGHADGLFGYVGPAGIGALGVLLIVVVVLLVGAAGLLLYPIRLVLSWQRRIRQQEDCAPQAGVLPPRLDEGR